MYTRLRGSIENVIDVYVCVCVCMYVCTYHVRMCVCMYVWCMFVCMYVCIQLFCPFWFQKSVRRAKTQAPRPANAANASSHRPTILYIYIYITILTIFCFRNRWEGSRLKHQDQQMRHHIDLQYYIYDYFWPFLASEIGEKGQDSSTKTSKCVIT